MMMCLISPGPPPAGLHPQSPSWYRPADPSCLAGKKQIPLFSEEHPNSGWLAHTHSLPPQGPDPAPCSRELCHQLVLSKASKTSSPMGSLLEWRCENKSLKGLLKIFKSLLCSAPGCEIYLHRILWMFFLPCPQQSTRSWRAARAPHGWRDWPCSGSCSELCPTSAATAGLKAAQLCATGMDGGRFRWPGCAWDVRVPGTQRCKQRCAMGAHGSPWLLSLAR